MAKLIDFGGSVDSNLVEGIGTNSVTFTMPGNVGLAVESVHASVNNSAGAATGAILTVTDQSGRVIAKQRQASPLDGGAANGTATWALRLAGDSGATAHSWARYRGQQVIPVAPASGQLDYIFVSGTPLLDLSNPLLPLVLRTGLYMASMVVDVVGVTAGASFQATIQQSPFATGRAQTMIVPGGLGGVNTANPTGFMQMNAGDFMNNIIRHDQAAAESFHHVTDIVYFT